jgi:hypothetical protein
MELKYSARKKKMVNTKKIETEGEKVAEYKVHTWLKYHTVDDSSSPAYMPSLVERLRV